MKNLHKLLRSISEAEQHLQASEFVAPCLPNEKVSAKLGGLVYQFQPEPADFEGWGIFLPEGNKRATLVGEADAQMISSFLKPLPKLRLLMTSQVNKKSWMAVPADEMSAKRLGKLREASVHLVKEGDLFDQIVARLDVDGKLWFEEIDPLAEPQHGDYLRRSFAKKLILAALQAHGLTPEMKFAYQTARLSANR
jgi:hypothetical protein